jgi:uncharacterized membrane protein YoaK (UPF0700 family)
VASTGLSCLSLLPVGTPINDHYQGTGVGGCKKANVVEGRDLLSERINAAQVKLVGAINEVKRRSPKARILMVDYMDVVPEHACYPTVPATEEDINWIHGKFLELNAMVARAAAATGVEFVDTYSVTGGHDMCQPPHVRWAEVFGPSINGVQMGIRPTPTRRVRGPRPTPSCTIWPPTRHRRPSGACQDGRVKARLSSVPAADLHVWLMLVLTFTTGINDAVGYLGLDKVFTGNMTGNVVILGMALVGAEDLPVLGPALALVGFLVGAAIGGRVLRRATSSWTPGTTWLFGAVAALMFVLGGVLVVEDAPGAGLMVTVTTVAAGAMGVQAAAARHIAVKDVTTVVVTSTITGLAADSVFGSGKATWRGGGSARRIAAVVLILAGATLGAALLQVHLAGGLIAAGVLIAGATVVGAWHAAILDH